MSILHKISPRLWLALGFLAFPLFSLASELLGVVVWGALGLFRNHAWADFGWGGFPGIFLGAPLGVVSALSAYGWRNGNAGAARLVAGVGGVLIGGWWLAMLLQCDPFVWVGDFGLATPSLGWAASLVLWACMTKGQRK